MPVTEREGHQLFVWFEGHLGPERAATMMNLLPPVDWDDLAIATPAESPSGSTASARGVAAVVTLAAIDYLAGSGGFQDVFATVARGVDVASLRADM